mgnify:CR=1 FL=1|tara:strand:- start:1078 stop:3435 length:2358 start_codon:yes stop_codon:yes gene_type:complete
MSEITLANSLKCTSFDGETEVTSSLNKFFNKISEGLGDAFEFVDELDEVVSDISDSMEGLTTAMTDFLEESVVGFISEGMQAAKNFLLNKFSLPFVGLAQNKAFENAMFKPLNGLFSAFGCLGSTIKKAMQNTVKNMLLNMIKNGFVNPIGCAIQDFIGGLTGKITNMVSGIIEPLMAPINNMLGIVGKAFGPIKGFLLKGMNLLGKIQGLINCADDDSSAECHVQETYDLFTGVGSKKDDPDKQNSFSKGLDKFTEKINNAGDNLDGLTGDIGYWGIFGGKTMTKAQKIEQLEKQIAAAKENDSEEEKPLLDQLNKRLKELNDRISKRLKTGSEIIAARPNESNTIKIGDWYPTNQRDFKMILKEYGSIQRGRTTRGKNVEEALVDGRNELKRVSKMIKDYLAENAKLEERIDAIQKEIDGLSGDGSKVEKLLSELEEVKQKPDDYKFKSMATDKDGNSLISDVELDCNTGNVFKCGLPKVKIFGGNGEGAVGDVILGNFIEEFDKAAAETEFVVDGEKQQVGSILDATASIIGVDIQYPGEGYTKEPIVRFEDNCKQGYGAFGKAIIDKDPNSPSFGQLIDVLIVSQGENYPAETPEDVYVKRIVVEDGGSGYEMDDKVGDFEICGLGENGQITKVCTNDRAYRSIPSTTVQSETGSGAILTPIMTRRPRPMEVVTVIDCITPRGNIVGYVNGKEYNGPFHVHPETGQKMVGIAHTTRAHATIYDTPQESLRGGTPSSNVGSTRIKTRSIAELITESETGGTTPPPSSPPPSTPPSSGGGGGY